MLKNLLLLLTIFTCTSLSAQIWDGGGDGTSWDDADNWSTDLVPAEGAAVTFPDGVTANVTGSAPNVIRRIIFDTLTTVTLDLDINFGVSGTAVHVITLSKDANVTFGGTTDMRTFNIETGIDRNAILLNSEGDVLTLTEQATLNINTCQNAVRMNKVDATFINNGTLNLVDYIEHGIYLVKGIFTNNGTIEIGTGTVDGDPTSDGINIDQDGIFHNNAEGTITVTQPLDDGVDILGIFNNAGTVSTLSKDDALGANSGLSIGSTNIEGVVNNLAGGIINTDAGIGDSGRGIAIQASGSLNNAGEINVSSGNVGQSLFNLGTLTNEICGHIDMIETRILNNNMGMLTNNGLITSSYPNSGINTAVDASVLNNAFYGYTNENADLSAGDGESIDNGQKTGTGIVVDAANSCTVTDIGIDVPYTWYTDLSGTVEAGTNDANGLLVLNDDIFAESGNHTLYTCFGEEVQLNVQNVSGDCALINGVDFIQLTDVFTMMPNPAQTYAQIKFGTEFIAEEKTIEVYNAVGQIVHTVNLNNADNYILRTNNFAAGIYTVNLKTEKGMQIERLIIQK